MAPPHKLDAFLDAVTWGAVSSTDIHALQAPFRSGVEIKDYQLDPVVRAIQMPRANLLIADDVGLGKTIEAGLVVQELLLRHRARTVLVVCPSSLQIQWRDQMRDKFGLDFRIVDSELLRELRRRRGLHVNPWDHFPRLITSIDFLKRDRPMRLMREVLPPGGVPTYPRRFDLLILDEAHNVAPSGRGNYATDSLRTDKGLDGLRVLDPLTVAYLDYPGSGVETIAHLRQNGRITLLFCAFQGPPRIVRIHGQGRVLDPEGPEYAARLPRFHAQAQPRAIISIAAQRISDSCGYGVPRFDYVGERPKLIEWGERKGPNGVRRYQQQKNAASLDGLPGLRWVAPDQKKD